MFYTRIKRGINMQAVEIINQFWLYSKLDMM